MGPAKRRGERLLVDKIAKFENLNEDLPLIFAECGVPLTSADIPRFNASNRRDYCEYYDDATKQLVEEYFRNNIETFGYGF